MAPVSHLRCQEGDGHPPLRPVRSVRDPNEAQFASVLPGMPGP